MKTMQSKRFLWFVFGCVTFALGLYLFFSWQGYGLGYPLDDAWIHQTYARNLAIFGKWMFLPGKVSGGSTSPLWTVLLVPAYFLNLNAIIWTTFLGFVLLFVLGWLSYRFLEQQSEAQPLWWLAGIVLLEWHFVWSALSGMETLLQTVFNLGIAVLIYKTIFLSTAKKSWFLLGTLIGVAVWVRPDAVTWVGPAALLAMIGVIKKESRIGHRILFFCLGFAIPFSTYLLFNLTVAGSIWPNTMYAKQAEYAAQLSIPFVKRFLQLLGLAFVGSTFLLIPGIIYQVWQAVKKRNMYIISLFLWWLGMIFIYALRLPVVYQHGRYMMPTMIFPILLGLLGTRELSKRISISLLWKDRLFFAAKALFIGLQLAFLVLGAQAFTKDVGIIETEMVDTALWVKDHIPKQAVLAVHDIGAMGYYSEHDFYDLAGLISPEVISIIRDEERLSDFLDEKKVDFVVVFPYWYEYMMDDKDIYFVSDGILSPSMGGEKMTIFCWKKCR